MFVYLEILLDLLDKRDVVGVGAWLVDLSYSSFKLSLYILFFKSKSIAKSDVIVCSQFWVVYGK